MRDFFQHITIPVTGGIELEAQLHPAKIADGIRLKKVQQEVAILAHPYGFLGGSLNDHVVQALKDVLCQRGIPVLLYNSRGVGKSTGRASWTGEPERRDYQALVDWVVNHRRSLPSWSGDGGADAARRMMIYCCGYSFGSVMAGQSTSPAPPQTEPEVELRYILISPPISSFVGFLLTPFRSGGLATALKRIHAEEPRAIPNGAAARSQVLIVYGSRDNFTSIATYRQWTSEISAASQSEDNKIAAREIPEADHFWSNPRCKSEMMEVISTWL